MDAKTGTTSRFTIPADFSQVRDNARRIWAKRWAKIAAVIIGLPIIVRDEIVEPLADVIPRVQTYYTFVEQIIFGLLIILFIIWEPDGLYKLWLRLKALVTRRRSSLAAQRGPATGGDARRE